MGGRLVAAQAGLLFDRGAQLTRYCFQRLALFDARFQFFGFGGKRVALLLRRPVGHDIVADFGKRAQDGKLTIEELTGGTFSISNGGVFGSMLSTPIINPPQSAILGVHATKDRPVVENGQIVIRPMNYLALSYDHRIIDGREAVLALVAMKEALEDPARMLLDI